MIHVGKARYALLAALLGAAFPVAAQPDEPRREVNITQDSEPGWIPSEELEAAALRAWAEYLLDAEQYEAAYAMLSSGLREMWPFEKFRADKQATKADIGSKLFRRPLKITWTKGGAAAPDGGTYAAIDTDAQFEGADRFCGYTIMHRPKDSDRFDVARIEENILSNASAEQFAANNSIETPDVIWNLVSRTCPNYVPPELPESVNKGSGFASVAEARAAVDALANTKIGSENGWTVISDDASLTVCSFSPEGSPFHPSLVRRSIIAADEGSSRMKMTVLCENTKRRCDALYAEMAARNGLLPISTE